mgnify:CR=1 FL=1|jgi:arsenate reductase (glutaredoxin)
MTTLFGIKNCDTIKKARHWLSNNGIAYQFHDYRSDGLEQEQLEQWCQELGWEQLLNRRGTTWRKLPDAVKETINEKTAVTLMLEQPAMIKRPLLDTGTQRLLGFKATEYEHIFRNINNK